LAKQRSEKGTYYEFPGTCAQRPIIALMFGSGPFFGGNYAFAAPPYNRGDVCPPSIHRPA
jgi:hypothetical protein